MHTTRLRPPRDRPSRLDLPRRAVVAALGVGLVLCAVLAAQALAARNDVVGATDRVQQTERLAGEIVHLDEVLTMSARMAAATGDLAWQDRYDAHVPRLDDALADAIALTADETGVSPLDVTDEANQALVAMEGRAFALVADDRAAEAEALLAGPGYEDRKRQYAAGLAGVVDDLVERGALDTQEATARASRGVVASLGVALVLALVALVLTRRFGRWADDVVAEERRRDEELRSSRDTLDSVVEAAPIVLFAVDTDERFVLSTGSALATLGVAPGEVVGRTVADVHRDTPDVVAQVRGALAGEVRRSAATIAGRSFETTYVPQFGPDRTRTGIIGVSVDVTEQRALQAEVERRRHRDAVTGLANRRSFERTVDRHTEDGVPLHAVLLDLTGFSELNESLGHEVGDAVLRAVAARLERAVPDALSVARIGNDEFGLLVDATECASPAALVALVRAAFGVPVDVDDRTVVVDATIGTASTGADGDDLVRDAELALYAAGRTNGTGIEHFSTPMRDRLAARIALRRELDRAIAEGEFELHYQPTVRLDTEEVVGLEALVRWQHPERGLLPPGQFIPFAEQDGSIVAIDRLVTRLATREAAGLRDRYGVATPWVAVNLSAVHLDRGEEVVITIRDALDASGLPPDLLVVEVTESAVMERVELVADVLGQLRDVGVGLALDDFGEGHSSLAKLHRLPVDTLKIDRSFVADLDRDDTTLVATIVALAERMGLATLAEGIESADQAALLRELGCGLGQGFHIARPLDPAALRLFLDARLGTDAGRAARRGTTGRPEAA